MPIIRKFIRVVLQFFAGLVIFLALLVGFARLLLPEVASLTDDIKAGVRAATGFAIEFNGISVGASLYGPELRLTDVTLYRADGDELIRAEKVAVSVDVPDSLLNRTLDPGRILVQGTELDALVTAAGEVHVQGSS